MFLLEKVNGGFSDELILTVLVPQSTSAEQGWECWEGQLQTHGLDKLVQQEHGQSLQAGRARMSWGGLSCPVSPFQV